MASKQRRPRPGPGKNGVDLGLAHDKERGGKKNMYAGSDDRAARLGAVNSASRPAKRSHQKKKKKKKKKSEKKCAAVNLGIRSLCALLPLAWIKSPSLASARDKYAYRSRDS